MRNAAIKLLVITCLLIGQASLGVAAGEAASPRLDYFEVGDVTAILCEGVVLWAGTQDGALVRIDSVTGQTLRYPYPKPGASLRDLARDGRGHIWAATERGGLGRFDGQSWLAYTPDNSDFPTFNVRAVAVDEMERVWAATDAGVAFLEEGQWAVYNRANSGLASDNVIALAVGQSVWCGTDAGLSVLGKGMWNAREWITFQSSNSGLPHDRITSLALDRSGWLWIGTEQGFAWTQDGSNWWTNPVVDGLVQDIAIDGAGTPWFNLGQGVGHLTGCRWAIYDASAIGLEAAPITAIALDARGRLWAGGKGGLAMLEPRSAQGTWALTEIKQPVSAIAIQGKQFWFMGGPAAVYYDATAGQYRATLPEYGLGAPVSAIAIDSNGAVWFATWGRGLTVFDREGWRVYETNTVPLPSNYIGAAAAVPGGGVLLGTSAGLVYQQGDQWNVYTFEEIGLRANGVIAIAVSADGRIAVGTEGSGISVYDGQRWASFNTDNSPISSDYTSSLVFDADGNLWVGTQGSGLSRFDGVHWTIYRRGPDGPGGDFVRALVVDRQGSLWAATEDGGLSEFDGCQWTTYDSPGGVSESMDIYALAVDDTGVLWVGAESGLWSFTPPLPYPAAIPPSAERTSRDTVRSVPVPQREVAQAVPDTDQWVTYGPGKSVHHIAFADDALWAATMDGGAVRWNVSDGTFTRFLYPQDGIGGNKVVYIAIDPLGKVWCAIHDRGVSVFDGTQWTIYDTVNSALGFNTVNSIAFGPAGQVWMATLGGGVSMFDGQSWVVYNTQNSGLAGDFVWQVAVDPLGRVWAGCMEGLSRFDGVAWYTYPDTSNVHCVSFDPQGRVWFGDGVGLNRVDGQNVIKVSGNLPRVYTRDVYAIAFDAQDCIWLGTGNGIFRFDGQNMVQFNPKTAGLRGRQIFAVTTGTDGRVWFGGDGEDGIASFDGSQWRYYTTAYGPHPPSADVISSLVDAQGRVWVGTDRGVSVYDGATWTAYTTRNSELLDDRVQAIAQDSAGRIWLGTGRGINILEGSKLDVLKPVNPALPEMKVGDILFDRQGRAWIGHSEGLSVFDGHTWQTFTSDNSPVAGNDINGLALDNQGRIWATSFWTTELSVFDGTTWAIVNPEDYGMMASFSSTVVESDLQGNIWVATSEGLATFDGARWTTYPLRALGLVNRSVSSLAFDAVGRIWVGSYGGVERIEGDSLLSYTVANSPLIGENVWTLATDHKGHVWIGVALGGLNELIPGTKRFPMAPTPTPQPTWTPYALLETPTSLAPPLTEALVPTDTPVPRSVAEATGIPPSPIFTAAWQQFGGAGGALGWAFAPAREVFCADQQFERGYMFWRNQSPEQGYIYVLSYADGNQDTGTWQGFVDTWNESQPQSAGHTVPPGLYEPVRGFGQVWQQILGENPPPPAIGWAIEPEQGSDGAQYQDFQGGVMLYSPRLNRVIMLLRDGTWRALPA